MEYKLKADSFSLLLKTKVYYSDIQYPENTILEIILDSSGFCACATMDIDIKGFRSFASEINHLYETLHGSVEITEPYGEQIIQFSADKSGHIFVSGMLHNNGKNGHNQILKFENSFDQTFLKSFVDSLNDTKFI